MAVSENSSQGEVNTDLKSTDSNEITSKSDPQEEAWGKVAGGVVEDEPEIPGKCEYVPWNAVSNDLNLNQDSFYEYHYRATHSRLMEQIVQHEQPTRMEVLFKLITKAHGFKSAGSRINRVLSKVLKKNNRLQITTEDNLKFVWLVDADVSHWDSFRVIDEFAYRRVPEDVAMPELVAMSRYFIDCGCDIEDAVVEMRKWFGMHRIGEKSKKRLEAAYKDGSKSLQSDSE